MSIASVVKEMLHHSRGVTYVEDVSLHNFNRQNPNVANGSIGSQVKYKVKLEWFYV
jgi:hypothetical protein